MSNRDEFSQKTKNALAARAGWHCSFSGCGKLTVGPSDESSDATTMIGKAAHICGAAPGQGSRRYDAAMTSDQRSGIDNGTWLCADHADLIDRDEVTYTPATLRAMKREHEAACKLEVRSGKSVDIGADLLAIGPDIVCTGDIQTVSATSWDLHLKHFVVGDVHQLISYIDRFATAAAQDQYVLSNALGDGRELSAAPSLTKHNDATVLVCPVAPAFARIDAQRLGSSMATHPKTRDIYLDAKGNIARVSGLDYLPQRIEEALSMQQGESVFAPAAGIRFFEYFEAFKESPWLALLWKLDVIRQAAIPYSDNAMKKRYTPLQCVTRVHGFELLSETPTNHRLPVHVDFDVQGIGRWRRDVSVYMPTKEQMEGRAKL